ncbi:MAG: hypothetical protein ABN479_12775 [Billgrantia sp.]|uniref:Uncharacterized protein n=1 Tax=Billgrantia desiderata TaxID=52021 RepID=A0ABS9BA97_9GAMM|nr:hypothetical protein [Halomonas desiderata]MCE8044509.1 hypothetical protein [Halomonas desiderata]MCE8049057.1 hypothetical protein [Halomonas desiderata]
MNISMTRKQGISLFGNMSLIVVGIVTGEAVSAAGLSVEFESQAEQRQFRQLDASELADIRGRYVQGNSVVLFGMEMSTVWQSPTGEVFETRADLQVDLSGAAPAVTFTPHVTATTGDVYQEYIDASGHQAVVIDSGSGNATGVVQVVQSGGDFNVAGNDFQLDINHGDVGQAGIGNGESQLTSDSGVQMSVQGGASGLGMSIVMPGQGEVTQGIHAGRGVHQSVSLTGSHQEVHNLARMQIQMDRNMGANVPTGDLRRALESTRNLERGF